MIVELIDERDRLVQEVSDLVCEVTLIQAALDFQKEETTGERRRRDAREEHLESINLDLMVDIERLGGGERDWLKERVAKLEKRVSVRDTESAKLRVENRQLRRDIDRLEGDLVDFDVLESELRALQVAPS